MKHSLRILGLATLASALFPAIGRSQTTSFTLSGASTGDQFGWHVARVGDVNVDGYDDFVVGAPGVNGAGVNRGRATVYSGKTRAALYSWNGAADNERFGAAVAGVGDVTGDGRPDILVGAPGGAAHGPDTGRAVLYSGATGAAWAVLYGHAAGELFGSALAGNADFDGDGRVDILIGSPGDDVNQGGSTAVDCGAVYAYSGATNLLLFRRAAFGDGIRLGTAVATIPDVDGDGRPDYAAGCPEYSFPGASSGALWVVSSNSQNVLHSINGPAGARLGTSVAFLGDVNGDGMPDLAVGAPYDPTNGTNAGAALVVNAASGLTVHTILGNAGDNLGYAVASLGDLDGDLLPDFAIGAPNASIFPLGQRGAVRLHSGLSGAAFQSFFGATSDPLFGFSVCSTGDVNADGIPDVAIGGPVEDGDAGYCGTVRLVLMGNAVGTGFCFGDGSGANCPCFNNSAPSQHAGCRNSLGAAGRLVASGVARVSDDSLVLAGGGMPNSTCLYFQGTTEINGGHGSVFGDGLRCAGGTVIRLGTKTNIFGGSIYPGSADPSVSVRGQVPPTGATRAYQVWYRNSADFCTSATYNLTNGVSVTWQP